MTTTAIATVRVQTNESRLLKMLKHAFTDRTTVVKELLQNARRSGATKIEVNYAKETDTLEIKDNGAGINDMQKLLSICESGWDEKTQETEHAYGIGFLSALYAAEEVQVESNGKRLRFSTARALSRADIPVEPATTTERGTTVRLVAVGLNDKGFDGKIEALVKGFPVCVRYNGKELPRPHAEDSGRTFTQVSIGAVHLYGMHDISKSERLTKTTNSAILYLQGFEVGTIGYYPYRDSNIIHLDSVAFVARMPDRDCLINSDEAKERIGAAVKTIWRETLYREIPAMDQEFVARNCYGVLNGWGALDLLNNNDYLPPRCLGTFTETPHIPIDSDGEFLSFQYFKETLTTRQQVESGEITVVRAADDDEDMLSWMARYVAGANIYNYNTSDTLHEGHWIFRSLKDFENKDITLTVHGAKNQAHYRSAWYGMTVQTCASYTIKSPLGKFVVDNEALVVKLGEDRIRFEGKKRPAQNGLLALIPSKEGYAGGVVKQASNYMSEDEYQEHDADEDDNAISRLVRSLRAENPCELLADALRDVDFTTIPTTHGKAFQVRINRAGAVKVLAVGR